MIRCTFHFSTVGGPTSNWVEMDMTDNQYAFMCKLQKHLEENCETTLVINTVEDI